MFTITDKPTQKQLFTSKNWTEPGTSALTAHQTNASAEGITLDVNAYQTEELTVFLTTIKCSDACQLSIQPDEYGLMMNFIIGGELDVQPLDGDHKKLLLTESAHYTILTAGNEDWHLQVKGEAELFTLCLKGNLLKRLFSPAEEAALQNRLSRNIWNVGQLVTPSMNDIITAVMHCVANNCLHRIFLSAKMLELLFINMEQLNNGGEEQPKGPFVRSTDLAKLKLAKTLVAENLRAPYSLVELAHQVGLNDFKLKKGFKEAFGTTVFGYLFELRMEKAQKILATKNYSVAEVAHEVGYKNGHHFSVAFKKKFGYLPSKLSGKIS